LATLDANGTLEGLPFMPEMLEYCGKRLRVSKRAHKTCDPPNGLGARRMAGAVHLEDARCDGRAHGGCQAGCLLFWKEAWLDRVSGPGDATATSVSSHAAGNSGCTETALWRATRAAGNARDAEPVYVCQSTCVAQATQPLQWWDLRQYAEDWTSGNVGLDRILSGLVYSLYSTVAEAGIGIGTAMRWAYDCFAAATGGPPYPSRPGMIPAGRPTPSARLDLQPGELVRVKSYPQILETLNDKWHNRGMYFDSEEVPFCGRTYEVLRRVERIIDEKTGRMLPLRNDAIILKGVVCESRYAKCRKNCPRAIYAYWREIWLERVTDRPAHASPDAGVQARPADRSTI
jgi:hypothetical protein